MKMFAILFLILLLFSFESAYAKLNLRRGIPGHEDDISKLLTGNPYYSNIGNHKLYTILTGFAHIMFLTVDFNNKNEIKTAIEYIKENEKALKIHIIPNFEDFFLPGGAWHGEYSHLGWNHTHSDKAVMETRKNFLRTALSKQFNFIPILDNKKLDSLSALLYYVHILGDHEYNEFSNARSRLPIYSLSEQDDYSDDNSRMVEWEKNDNNDNGIPLANIIEELNYHLNIIFKNPQNKDRLEKTIDRINGHLPDDQKEKAKWLLQILFDNVPYLLKEETFAKDFVKLL
jgi:hypothetical protein